MRRGRMARGHSRQNFRRGSGIHPRNQVSRVMRGGIRL